MRHSSQVNFMTEIEYLCVFMIWDSGQKVFFFPLAFVIYIRHYLSVWEYRVDISVFSVGKVKTRWDLSNRNILINFSLRPWNLLNDSFDNLIEEDLEWKVRRKRGNNFGVIIHNEIDESTTHDDCNQATKDCLSDDYY